MVFEVGHKRVREIKITNEGFVFYFKENFFRNRFHSSLSEKRNCTTYSYSEIDKLTIKEHDLYFRAKENETGNIHLFTKMKLQNPGKVNELISVLSANSFLKHLHRKESSVFAVVNHSSFYLFMGLITTLFLFFIGKIKRGIVDESISKDQMATNFYNLITNGISESIFSVILILLIGIVSFIMYRVYKNPKEMYLFKCCV